MRLREVFLGAAMLLTSCSPAFAAECVKLPDVPATSTIETYSEPSDVKKLLAAAQTPAVAAATVIVVVINSDDHGTVYYLGGEACILAQFPVSDSNVEAVFAHYGVSRQKGA